MIGNARHAIALLSQWSGHLSFHVPPYTGERLSNASRYDISCGPGKNYSSHGVDPSELTGQKDLALWAIRVESTMSLAEYRKSMHTIASLVNVLNQSTEYTVTSN